MKFRLNNCGKSKAFNFSYILRFIVIMGLIFAAAAGINTYIKQLVEEVPEIDESEIYVSVPGTEQYVREFLLRKKYIENKLNKTREEKKEEFVQALEKEVEEGTKDLSTSLTAAVNNIKNRLIDDFDNNIYFKSSDNTVIASPAGGLTFKMNDPRLSTTYEEAADGTVTIEIYDKINSSQRTMITNSAYYNNGMRYIENFFEGIMTRQDLDEAIAEAIPKSKNLEQVVEITEKINYGRIEEGEDKVELMDRQHQLTWEFGDEVIRTFNGKKYIFQYNDYLGIIRIRFTIDV